MSDKFNDIPRDSDTKIIFTSPMRWGEFDIVYEKWYWDGINAESIIFLTKDISSFDDVALEADVRDGPLVRENSQVTIKRGENFTFVNFNFVS